MKRTCAAFLLFLCVVSAHAAVTSLTIVKAGPVGEVASLAEANEIRVVFSEPMVVVGRIPKVLVVPWFHVEPAIKGALRWSGTTTLIFTPDPKATLPFGTKYDVTIDAEAKAVSGKTLGRPYHFSFTTPTIQLLRTSWYRKGGKYDGGIVIAVWFNQPLDAGTLASHLQLRTVAHEFKTPEIPARDRLMKLEPQQVAAFDAKGSRCCRSFRQSGTQNVSQRCPTSSSWRRGPACHPIPIFRCSSTTDWPGSRPASPQATLRPSRSSSSRRSSSRRSIA